MSKPCRACGKRAGVKQLEVTVSRAQISRWFLVQVCAECEEIWQTMLEAASIAHQWTFPGVELTRG